MVALPKPELVAFIDESGDFELSKIDPHYPVCAQCALTCTVDEYLANAVPNMMNLKYHFFGNEAVVMHGHKIRRRSPPFHILREDEIRQEFMDAISWAIEHLDGCLIVAAVHKPRHVNQYINPDDPFFLSLQFLLERLYMHWATRLVGGRRLLCVFEKRGAKEDERTVQWFDEICQGKNWRGQKFPFDADFRSKEDNVIGHQYADLVAYAACRFVETGDDGRKDWQAVKEKLRKVAGRFETHGLKIFP
jgi:hypothetical protein